MRISQIKKDKITEQIIYYLYHIFPKIPYTAEIAREIARDEEFLKDLLLDLKDKGIVIAIKKNKEGITFSRRIKWRLNPKVYNIYKEKNK